MGEAGLPEAAYGELLEHTMEVIGVVKGLMRSKDEEVQVYATDAFIKLSENAATLLDILYRLECPVNDANPLARRARGGGREIETSG